MRRFFVVVIYFTSFLFLGTASEAFAQAQDPCSTPFGVKVGERDPCVIKQNDRLKTMQQELGTKVGEAEMQKELSDKADKVDVEQRLAVIDKKISVSQGKATFNVDRLWVLLAAVLVFFMQAGFCALEVGMVSYRLGALQAAEKLFSWIITYVGYTTIGFGLMFAATHSGMIGQLSDGPSSVVDAANSVIKATAKLAPDEVVRGIEFFLFQAAFAATAVTIPAGATAGRLGLKAYLLVAFFISAWIYPVYGHWAWGGGIYSASESVVTAAYAIPSNIKGWLEAMGFHDFAGSSVVHTVGGSCALILAIFLKPREGRFEADGTPNVRFSASSHAYAILGVFMLWFGWWGFNGGSKLGYDPSIATVILNTNLAGAAAALSAYAVAALTEHLDWDFVQKGFIVEKVIGGVLGGLVAITASCDIATPTQAFFLVGLLAGVVHNIVFDLLLWCKIDDPVGAVPVHMGCGVLGTLLVAFTDKYTGTQMAQLVTQLTGAVAAIVWSCSMAGVLCLVLRGMKAFRAPEVIWITRNEHP